MNGLKVGVKLAETAKKHTNGFQEVIKDNASLVLFVKKLGQFDKMFCDLMATGVDYNIRLEVRGDKGEIIHVRIMSDDCSRPDKG